MTEFTKWLRLNISDVAPSTPVSGAGSAVEFPSPYDVPTHARMRYDETTGIFDIELRYISDEKVIERKASDHLTLRVGKDSRRIFGMRMDVHSFNRERNANRRKVMEESAQELIRDLNHAPASNAHLAANAFRLSQRELFCGA